MFGNIGDMMKKAQQMQAKMAEAQERLKDMDVEGSAGNGMVKITMTGAGVVKAVKLDGAVVDPSDVEMLEDLLVAALGDARTKSEALAAQEMSGVTGGMKLPGGLKLPF